MSLVTIEYVGEADELFNAPEFPVLPPGKHLFVVSNDLEIGKTSSEEPKSMIRLIARCQDDETTKGMVVFDNFLLIQKASTEKEAMAKRIHDTKLAQFVCSCGISTPARLKAKESFDIADCNGKFFEAMTGVRMEPVFPAELDEQGTVKKTPRSFIKQYLFTTQEASVPLASG